MKHIKTFEGFVNERTSYISTPETSEIIKSFIMTHSDDDQIPEDMEAAISEILNKFKKEGKGDFGRSVKTYYRNARPRQCEDLYDAIDATMR